MADNANVNFRCLSSEQLQDRLLDLCELSALNQEEQEELNTVDYSKQLETLKASTRAQHLTELEQSELANQNELESSEKQLLEMENDTLNIITEPNHEIQQLSTHLENLQLQYKVDFNLQQAEVDSHQLVDENTALYETLADYKQKHYNLNEKLNKQEEKSSNYAKQKTSVIMQKNDQSIKLQDMKYSLMGTMEEEISFNENLEADLTLTRIHHQTLFGNSGAKENINSVFNEVDVDRTSVKDDYLQVKRDYMKATHESTFLNKILKELKSQGLTYMQNTKFQEKYVTPIDLQNAYMNFPKTMKSICTSLVEALVDQNMVMEKPIDCADFDLFLSSNESKKIDDLNIKYAEDKSINHDYNHKMKQCEQEISSMEKQINEIQKNDEKLIDLLNAATKLDGNNPELCSCKLQK